jgi:hypothetical protein
MFFYLHRVSPFIISTFVFDFSIPTGRILKDTFDSGRKTNNLRIMKGPLFKFSGFIFIDLNGKCHLVG